MVLTFPYDVISLKWVLVIQCLPWSGLTHPIILLSTPCGFSLTSRAHSLTPSASEVLSKRLSSMDIWLPFNFCSHLIGISMPVNKNGCCQADTQPEASGASRWKPKLTLPCLPCAYFPVRSFYPIVKAKYSFILFALFLCGVVVWTQGPPHARFYHWTSSSALKGKFPKSLR